MPPPESPPVDPADRARMTLVVEVGPLVDPALARALEPVFASVAARDDLPEGAMVVVGAPSAGGLARAMQARALVAVPAHVADGDPFFEPVRERADAIIDLEPPAPVPGTATGIAAADSADPRAAEVFALLDGFEQHRGASLHPVRVVSGDRAGVLRAREAWAAGAAVVALPGPAAAELRATGAALVAGTTLEAAEAVALLARTPRLAMALARRGRDLLATLPRVDEAAATVADALRQTATA